MNKLNTWKLYYYIRKSKNSTQEVSKRGERNSWKSKNWTITNRRVNKIGNQKNKKLNPGFLKSKYIVKYRKYMKGKFIKEKN